MTNKLYYFDIVGLGEGCRLALCVGGVKFENITFNSEEWASKYRKMSPTKKCPFVVCEDGKTICESTAIIHWALSQGPKSLMPHTPEDYRNMYTPIGYIDNIRRSVMPMYSMSDNEKKTFTGKLINEILPEHMNRLDQFMAPLKDREICIADIFVCGELKNCEKHYLGWSYKVDNSKTNLIASMNKVLQHPAVKEFYKNK